MVLPEWRRPSADLFLWCKEADFIRMNKGGSEMKRYGVAHDESGQSMFIVYRSHMWDTYELTFNVDVVPVVGARLGY